jgi:hypothetical protein
MVLQVGIKCLECGKPVNPRWDRVPKFCSRKCANVYNSPHPFCECGCGKKPKTNIGIYCAGHNPSGRLGKPGLRGKDNPRWTGGKPKRKHSTPEHREFRKKVFERDSYTCQKCGLEGNTLRAHHIIPVSIDNSLISDINNGITFCHNCHWQEHRNSKLTYPFSIGQSHQWSCK